MATNRPNANRNALPIRIRFSSAVAQFSKSRRRHGETVNQIPAITSKYAQPLNETTIRGAVLEAQANAVGGAR